jgi:hypothetical protein
MAASASVVLKAISGSSSQTARLTELSFNLYVAATLCGCHPRLPDTLLVSVGAAW